MHGPIRDDQVTDPKIRQLLGLPVVYQGINDNLSRATRCVVRSDKEIGAEIDGVMIIMSRKDLGC